MTPRRERAGSRCSSRSRLPPISGSTSAITIPHGPGTPATRTTESGPPGWIGPARWVIDLTAHAAETQQQRRLRSGHDLALDAGAHSREDARAQRMLLAGHEQP